MHTNKSGSNRKNGTNCIHGRFSCQRVSFDVSVCSVHCECAGNALHGENTLQFRNDTCIHPKLEQIVKLEAILFTRHWWCEFLNGSRVVLILADMSLQPSMSRLFRAISCWFTHFATLASIELNRGRKRWTAVVETIKIVLFPQNSR